MPRKKCLWRAVATGECITKKKIDDDIAFAYKDANNDLERSWLKHPMFKKNLIEMCRREESYPSTVIEGLRIDATNEDIKNDLRSWQKSKRRK